MVSPGRRLDGVQILFLHVVIFWICTTLAFTFALGWLTWVGPATTALSSFISTLVPSLPNLSLYKTLSSPSPSLLAPRDPHPMTPLIRTPFRPLPPLQHTRILDFQHLNPNRPTRTLHI